MGTSCRDNLTGGEIRRYPERFFPGFNPRCNSLMRFIDLMVRCGSVEATDKMIISRHSSTVPWSGILPFRRRAERGSPRWPPC
jgi:hypothetical protein